MKKKKIRLNIVSRSKVAVAFHYLQLAVMSPILIPVMLVQIQCHHRCLGQLQELVSRQNPSLTL